MTDITSRSMRKSSLSQLQQKSRDRERSGRPADFGDVCRPFLQQTSIIGEGAAKNRDHLIVGEGNGAGIRLRNELCVSLFLTGYDLIDNDRTGRRDCFLDRRPTGFANENVMRGEQLRQFRRPADDGKFLRGSIANRFDIASQFFVAADRDRELTVRNPGQPGREVGSQTLARVYDLQNSPWWAGRTVGERGKTWTDRKAEDAQRGAIDAGLRYDIGGLVIRDQEIIGRTTIPDRIDRDRIGNTDDASGIGAVHRPIQLIEKMCIRHKNRNDYVGAIVLDNLREACAGAGKPAEPMMKIRVVINPGINLRPNMRRAIDREEIHAPDKLVDRSERFRKNITAFDCGIGRNLRETIADSARGAVMAFTESGGKNEDFFHSGSRRGSLMDNCAGQSTLAAP